MAARLQELVRREREFAANASHQLRTPITALRLELEDLTLQPETPAVVSEQLTRSIDEVDRLAATVNDLLDLARNRRLEAVVDINLRALVEDTVARWRRQAAAAGRKLVLADGGVVAVHQPAGPIGQTLDILIENALKHGAGPITVDVDEPEGYVRVRVRDEGARPVGNEVFNRHVQGPTSTGEGIGLAVATEIAEALGGHLTLEPDDRTTFSLMLPKPGATWHVG